MHTARMPDLATPAANCSSHTADCSAASLVVSPPKVAFVVAGAARSFLRPEVWGSYLEHVLVPFGAGRSAVFLYLRDASHCKEALLPLLAQLRERGWFGAMQCEDTPSVAPPPLHARCAGRWAARRKWTQVRDYAPRAHRWWSAMAASWQLVEQYEREEPGAGAFEMVVFSRPDLFYVHPMGRWCAYARDTWHSGGALMPDMFWIMPRAVAANVLNRTDATFFGCAPHQPCCQDLGYVASLLSWWPTSFWTRQLGTRLRDDLLGSARVASPSNAQWVQAFLGCRPRRERG